MTTMTPTDIRSQRLRGLPPYLFVEIDRQKRARIEAGADVIDLGVGDPDRPTPRHIIEEMQRAAADQTWHRYAPSVGTMAFREAAARFMKKRFGVEADPKRHICQCIGSKEGIAHLPLAVVNPGDVVLAPIPGYPVYVSGGVFAGAEVSEVELTAGDGWLPRFDRIDPAVADRAKLMWANYPNNPTAACTDVDFFESFVKFTQKRGIIACSDHAYSEVYFDEAPPSMWQAPSASLDDTAGIEFHSLSKTFNMTGWRCAFAIGRPDIISALAAVKGNCDSGQFGAIQAAGAMALDKYDHPDVAAMREVYRERRDTIVPLLREIGAEVDPPKAGFFVWGRCPGGMDSMTFASRALEQCDVVLVPGAGFGRTAKSFFRIALTVEVERLKEAGERLRKVDWTG
jgi:LL-diaminopimelate aminotransferase